MINPSLPPLFSSSPIPSVFRVYLNILPDVNMGAKDTVTQFKQTMDVLISKFATRLLKLNVDEVEVKVRLLSLITGLYATVIC